MEVDLSNIDAKSAGLRGQVAGQTSLSTVGQTGAGLTYRGYDVTDLAEHCEFEEIAFLLIYGHLPNRSELQDYKNVLANLRDLPNNLKKALDCLLYTSPSPRDRG